MIRLNFEKDAAYYSDGWKAFELAKSIKDEKYKDKTTIHFYWRVPREFGRKQAAAIRSAIVTQLDVTGNVNIVLWSNVDLSNNPHVKPLVKFIELKIYNPFVEAMGTPLEHRIDLLGARDQECYVDGDLFRILILYKYGGVYCDCDVFLLRSLAPLIDCEFVYQWGTELDQMNGAVMRAKKGSAFSCHLLDEIVRSEYAPGGSVGWGSQLYRKVRDKFKDFTVFPCMFFNSEWQVGYNMGESHHPMRARAGDVEMFDGAFAWHWHNKWDDVIEVGSKFYLLEKKQQEIFERIGGIANEPN